MEKEVKLFKSIKKTCTLPSLDDEEDFTYNENLSTSIVEGSFLCSTTSLSPGEEENEDELPVGILKPNIKNQKLKAGDLAWIKHSRKFCFWPSYIKAINGTKVSAYFICYNKFLPNEKSFRYSLNSKNIKKYSCSISKTMIEDGRNFLSKRATRKSDDKVADDLVAFNNAVELAEAYILYRSNKEFTNQSEEYDFFRSNGLSLCLKSTIGDHDSTSCTRPPTPVEEHSEADESSSLSSSNLSHREPISFSEQLENSNPSRNASKRLFSSVFNPERKDGCSQPTSSVHSPCETLHVGTMSRKSKRKRTDQFFLFNRNNERLVDYIVGGNCDKRLLRIFNLKIQSERMKAYFEVWDLHSVSPKANNMKLQHCYFGTETHLEVVSSYLLHFINTNLKQVKGLTKKDELLFNVFLPEATIYSIHKVRRHSLAKAEEVFRKGHSGRDMPVEPLLRTPLTDEERASVERRNRNFAQKLGLLIG